MGESHQLFQMRPAWFIWLMFIATSNVWNRLAISTQGPLAMPIRLQPSFILADCPRISVVHCLGSRRSR